MINGRLKCNLHAGRTKTGEKSEKRGVVKRKSAAAIDAIEMWTQNSRTEGLPDVMATCPLMSIIMPKDMLLVLRIRLPRVDNYDRRRHRTFVLCRWATAGINAILIEF